MAKVEKQFNLINKSSPQPIAGFYLLGVIGSWLYFIQSAVGFGEHVVDLLKALVWPAYLVNTVFELLKV